MSELVLLPLLLAPLVVGLLAVIDVARRGDADFAAAGQSRTTWLVVAVLSLVVPCLWLAAGYYLLAIRPKVASRG